MSTPDDIQTVTALARAVDLLRRSSEPGAPQKDALRSLVAVAAERSATLRWYNNTLTLDGAVVPTTDPRLGAFTERLVAQNVAEITIAKDAGPDELLALTLGLAAEPGQGRIKERLRDAGSARVMVILHQYEQRSDRSVSAAFDKVKFDQSVLSEWNRFLEQGARAEADRVADSRAAGLIGGGSASAPSDPGIMDLEDLPPPAEEPPGPPVVVPPPIVPRQPRPSTIQQATTPDGWFASFERGFANRFSDHFGTTDWDYRIDRAAGTVRAEDRHGRSNISVSLPRDYLEQSSWLLAGKVVEELRRLAEADGAIRKRR